MKKTLKIFLIIALSLSITTLAFADDPLFLQKGSPSPSDGYLFSKEKTLSIRQELIEKDNQQPVIDSLNKELDLYKTNSSLKDQQLTITLQQNTNLIKEKQNAIQSESYEKIIYFGLGVLATGLAIYGAKEITK